MHNFSILLGQGTYIDNDTRGETVTYNNIPVTECKDAAFSAVPDDQIVASAYIGTEHRRLTYDYDEKYLFTGIIRRLVQPVLVPIISMVGSLLFH